MGGVGGDVVFESVSREEEEAEVATKSMGVGPSVVDEPNAAEGLC
jgi:hypothetical protein